MNDFDIAVIGLACRVPGAANAEEFWDNLVNSRESVCNFNDTKLRAEGIDEELLRNPHFVKAGTVFEDVDLFDASFFGFSPAEAETLDPQQRIFLELACEAIEQGGYGGPAYRPSIGVYAGMGTNDYVPGGSPLLDLPIVVGGGKDFLATLVSYKLNLTGPSITVQTACSTSLVAVHLACQGLLAGDCAMALAGGISIAFPPRKGYMYEPGGILSPDGHCRAFDKEAGGTISGSGAGLVLLKPLRQAVMDGDVIHAIIKGSAINNDGSLKVGFTAPSIEGQAKAIRAAQSVAGVEAESVTYIEAHGTGTAVGDPIEIAALTKAFRESTQKKGFCAIGSVKTNIGHLNTAAGVIGLIKTILALEHKQIPASLHYRSPNPKIDFENSPFFVNPELRPWNAPRPLRAGVSSFGVGGTNAHVILEEAPAKEPSGPARSSQLLVLSARTPTALNAAAQNLVTHFHRRREDNLADIAYTLQVGRQEFAYRQAVVSKTCEEAIECLPCLPLGQIRQGMEDEKGPAVLFLFPGQGTQFVGMGKEIYEEDKLFRHVVDQCCEKLKPFMGIDLRELLYPPESKSEWARKKLQETAITQPAIFVIEYALARLWMQWGIRPQAMLGHSIGEYAAACLAGVIDEDDALRLISLRGRLIQEQPSGSMLVVALSEEECLSELQPGLWLAAANGQRQCVLSGTHEAIEALQKRLESRSVYCHRLQVSHAFHSGMMEPLLKRFAEEVQGIRLGKPCLRYVSSLSGDWMLDQAAIDPQYWVRHLRHTVRFAAGIKTLFDDIPNCVFLEVGPGENLARLVCEESSHHEEVVVASSMPRTASSEGGMAALLRAAGRLWTAGAKLQWHQFHQDEKRSRVPLPVYPFERKHYSISESLGQCKAAANAARTKRPDPADWFYLPVWKQAPFAQAGRQLRGEEWLIFVDDGELGKTLVDLIVAAGHRVLLVKRGEQRVFHQDVFTINPGAREDYVAFVMELKRRKRMPHKILHLWSNPDRKDASKSGLPADVGCLSLLLFSQSLEAQNLSSPIRLIAITADAHQVTGNEDLSPSAASVLGACLVISQEFPNLQCRCIDISIPDFYSPLGSKCQLALIKDFTSDHPDFLTAYRSGQRWVRTFEQIHLQVGCKPSRLREGGVYLITGGLGKIGLKVAEYLSEKVKAKLVLVSRTKLPAQENWEEYLRSHISNTKAYCTLEKLSTLRKLGSEIIVASADVSKIKDVLRVIDETHARFGSIHGVFHAAGHTDPASLKPIGELTVEDFEAHFSPKVTGLRVLQTALAAEPLDFMMFFSSLSAVLGGIGFSAYAAANVFMDSYSYYWRQQGLCPCMSLNWDGWDFAEANGRFSAGNKLAPPILPEEGIQVLNSILYADETYSQVVVSTTDLFKRITEWVEPPHRYKTAPRISALHTVDRAVVTSEYVAPQNSLEEAVAEIWEEMLGISELGIYDNFIQLGGHSLLGMRICTRIRALFEINFTVEHLYESPTIAGITEFITKTLINGLDANQIDGLIKHL